MFLYSVHAFILSLFWNSFLHALSYLLPIASADSIAISVSLLIFPLLLFSGFYLYGFLSTI